MAKKTKKTAAPKRTRAGTRRSVKKAPRRSLVCADCSKELKREVRHKASRSCALVRAQSRYEKTAGRRAADSLRKRDERTAAMLRSVKVDEVRS